MSGRSARSTTRRSVSHLISAQDARYAPRMSLPAAPTGLDSGLDAVRVFLGPGGADVTPADWDAASGRLPLRLEIAGAECPECIIPQPMLGELMLGAIQEHAPAVQVVDLDDPRESDPTVGTH